MSGYYHYLTYWRKAPNAMGCCEANKVIASAAETIDEAANERSKIAASMDERTIIALSTHDRGVGPGVSS